LIIGKYQLKPASFKCGDKVLPRVNEHDLAGDSPVCQMFLDQLGIDPAVFEMKDM